MSERDVFHDRTPTHLFIEISTLWLVDRSLGMYTWYADVVIAVEVYDAVVDYDDAVAVLNRHSYQCRLK